MNFRSHLICLLLAAFLGACDRTVDYVAPSPDNDLPTQKFKNIEVRINLFQVEAEIGDTLVLKDSTGYAPTLLFIPQDLCVYGNGAPCQGELDVQLIQAFTKADMIFSDIPTTSKQMPLESGGAFYLNITQNGQQLFVRPEALFKIKAPIDRTSGDSDKMMFYTSENTGNQLYDWSLQGPLADIDEVYYTLEFNALDRWMNVDYEIQTEVGEFSVSLVHDGLPVSGAQVFFSFDDFNSISKASFVENTSSYKGFVPRLTEFQVVAIQKEGDLWYWNQSQVIQNDNTMELSLKPVGYQELVASLKKL